MLLLTNILHQSMQKEVQFTYHISSPGLAKGEVIVSDNKVSFEVNNASNPLYDLLKGMVSMIYEPSHLWDEENICWVDWYNHDCCYKWILSTLDGSTLHIRLSYLNDIYDDDTAKVIINSNCTFQSFYQAIVEELDRFIKECGLLNYEQHWQKDEFPLTYFLILKKYVIDQGLWSHKKTNNTTNTSFLDELNFLQA